MKVIRPHEFFKLDFDQIIEEGRRQEELLSANKGEFAFVKNMHTFFSTEVLPRVLQDTWVYEAAERFASQYAMDCFNLLRLTGDEIYRTQQRKLQLNNEVIDTLVRAKSAGAVPEFKSLELEKTSDFKKLILIDRLSKKGRDKVESLYLQTVDHERLHVLVALRSIRDHYEITLPRIMFVIRRAMKRDQDASPSPSDDNLSSISEYITWYSKFVPSNHALFPVLGELKDFFLVARNVGNHHQGFSWNSEQNLVILEDRNLRVEMNVTTYLQKHRYLIHLCELGVRGILSAFCQREQGPISDYLVKEYAKIFPSDWVSNERGIVQLYSENQAS